MPAPLEIARRGDAFSPDPSRSPLLHPALSNSLSRSFGMNSPFSLSVMSTSLKDLSSSPGFSSMAMSLGRSFEERPKIEAQFFKNFTCCGLDLQDLHGLLEHFEECHVAFDDDSATDGGMDIGDEPAESEGTVSAPPSPGLAGQVAGGRAGYEAKKTGLSSFEMLDSPVTQALHLDGGMELDMDMGDEAEDHSSPSSVGSASSHLTSNSAYPQPQTMSAFENPLPLHGSAKKKQQQQQQNQPFAGTSIPPSATTITPALAPFDTHSRAASSQPGTPAAVEDKPNPLETLPTNLPLLPVGTVNPVAALGTSTATANVGGLAPSLLFPPGSSSQSPPSPNHHPIHETPEPEEEEEEEEEDSSDEEGDYGENPYSDNGYSENGSMSSFILPISLPPVPPGAPRPKHSPSTHTMAAQSLAALPPRPVINPHDPHTIAALANTTLKDPMQTAAAIAALGPNSLAALPTALHPLGQGVQISPSGRPYTPPSEKPFKCTVPGCDKSYKQQNGLKYHRLHGHCGANAVKDGVDPRSEGKPYVCHVASCGKRYKNMNGLRYHYQHSGAHGALGLQMLAQGCHPPPQFPPGHKRGTVSHHQLAQSYTVSSAGSSRASSPAPHHRYGESRHHHGGMDYHSRGVDAAGVSAALGRYQ
ncbi:hypothetical protein JCM8547_002432 [Rhodosporidiobolus lusitaniae]